MDAERSSIRPLVVSTMLVGFIGALAGVLMLVLFDHLEDDARKLGGDSAVALEVARLSDAAKELEAFVANEHLRETTGDRSDTRVAGLLEADGSIVRIEGSLERLAAQSHVPPELVGIGDDLRIAFLSYLANGNAAELQNVGQLASQIGDGAAALQGSTDEQQPGQAVLGTISTVRWLLVAVVLVATPMGMVANVWSGRRYRDALRIATARERSLSEANRSLARRNDQFNSMYQVVTEVTESLSMKYVVQTTVREARQLVEADLVVLHIVEGQRLVLAGSASEEGETTGGLLAESVELGEGLVGRAAKRGRTLRLKDVSNAHGHGPALPGAQAGIVVPLIVGARVVGTVSCWAKEETAFSDDDERVLEMMASQVATAIAAADVYEETDGFAHRDGLTELPNRRQLTEDIKYEFDRAVRRGREMTVAMIDVDHFKRFNDEHGHHAGDVALQRIAKALAGTLRDEDRLYRYGGEEFAVVLDRGAGEQAEQISERLRQAVSELPPLEGEPARVTISIGLAHGPRHAANFDELLEKADEALYDAKESGRNRVVVYEPDSHAARDAA